MRPLTGTSPLPPPPAPGNHHPTVCLYVRLEIFIYIYLFKFPHISLTIQYSSFSVLLISLIIMPPGSCVLSWMAGFPSFLWLNNILLCCIYITVFNPYLHRHTCRLFSYLGCCEQCCHKHGSTDASSKSLLHFLWVYSQKWDCWITWEFYF